MKAFVIGKSDSAAMSKGWTNAKLEDVVDILDSQRVPINAKERESRKGKVPYYGATGQVGWIDNFLFDEELILLGEDGAPFLEQAKQKAYIIRGKSWVNNHAHVLRARNGIPNSYIKYYLDIVDYHRFVSGTTRLKLNQSAMRQIPVPIAPPDQQKLIVAEIEKQFSRLDEAIASLKRIKANLKRYKASVLKAAVEGKLTEEWRKTHPNVEHAEKLLKRILAERKKKWEEKNPGKKYKEPATPDTSNLPELPEGWVWIGLGELIDEPKYGTSKKCDYKTDGIGVLRIPNIVNGFVDVSDLKFAKFDEIESQAYRLREGDILTIRSNGSVSLVGKCALVTKSDEKYLYAGYLIRISPLKAAVHSKYLMTCFSSLLLRKQIESKAKSTSGVNNINSGELQSLIIPICGRKEQDEIVRIVDEKLSGIEYLLLTVDLNLKRAERLRQAILKKAFSGRLVSQSQLREHAGA